MQPKAGRVAGGVGGLQPAPAPLWCALLGDLATPAVRSSLGEGHPRPAIQWKWCLPCCSKRGVGAFLREHFVIIDVHAKQRKKRCQSGTSFSFRHQHLSNICAVDQLHPDVEPQVSHFMHVPLRTRVKLPHSPQGSPS